MAHQKSDPRESAKKVLKIIKASDGMTITELTSSLKISRSSVRIPLAFLEGQEEIKD